VVVVAAVVDMVLVVVVCPTLALFVCIEGSVKWAGILGFVFGAGDFKFLFQLLILRTFPVIIAIINS
jgi:hypothetical protein